jgi:hypothetical protein
MNDDASHHRRILAICTEAVFYGESVSSDYQEAVRTAAAVLEAGAQRLQVATALLTEPAMQDLPIELAAALVASYDQLDAALVRLLVTLSDQLNPTPPDVESAPLRIACGTSGRGWP